MSCLLGVTPMIPYASYAVYSLMSYTQPVWSTIVNSLYSMPWLASTFSFSASSSSDIEGLREPMRISLYVMGPTEKQAYCWQEGSRRGRSRYIRHGNKREASADSYRQTVVITSVKDEYVVPSADNVAS